MMGGVSRPQRSCRERDDDHHRGLLLEGEYASLHGLDVHAPGFCVTDRKASEYATHFVLEKVAIQSYLRKPLGRITRLVEVTTVGEDSIDHDPLPSRQSPTVHRLCKKHLLARQWNSFPCFPVELAALAWIGARNDARMAASACTFLDSSHSGSTLAPAAKRTAAASRYWPWLPAGGSDQPWIAQPRGEELYLSSLRFTSEPGINLATRRSSPRSATQ